MIVVDLLTLTDAATGRPGVFGAAEDKVVAGWQHVWMVSGKCRRGSRARW